MNVVNDVFNTFFFQTKKRPMNIFHHVVGDWGIVTKVINNRFRRKSTGGIYMHYLLNRFDLCFFLWVFVVGFI